ncbi:MAG: SUMF1/EgtB/PvdO family nonheme iron enzyme [Anaerolineae bacterium]|nr:SUMF1/EgtB/PvdO family nonheme iron enzyme [Anaerolineae bacterium]
MPDIFISYSRSNLVFVQQLVQTLSQRGKNPWFDQIKEPLQGIPPGSRWWDEITYGIENADNFLLVISPQSIASPYCHAEIAHARQHDKRIVTLLYCGDMDEKAALEALDEAIESIPDDSVLPTSVTAEETHLRMLVRKNWLALSQIQYVSFSEQQVEAVSIEQLMQALDLDLAWIKMRSQIRQAAQLWADNDYLDGYLWSQERLKSVYEMLERVTPKLSVLEEKFLEPEAERLLRELENIKTSHPRRSAIGERVSVIGDPRSGVGLSPHGLPEINWCYVEGGDLTIEQEQFKVKPFYIARYLITYIQFQAFLDDPEGFAHDAWWMFMPSVGHSRTAREPRSRYVSYPRDTVSWYQAVAFTRWLAARTPQDELPEGTGSSWGIRLPTEWEWQWAAQGGKQTYEYPWGIWDTFPRANTSEAGLSRTTAVGMYASDRAACGALDMAGNLCEWCLNEHDNIRFTASTSTNERVRRGGSFASNRLNSTCTYRGKDMPFFEQDYYGFRIVYAPATNLE